MDELYLPYVLDSLTPAERAAVEAHLAAHPAAAAEVAAMRRAVAPLAADRDGYDPPRGLAAAAVGRVARFMVAHGMHAHDGSRDTLKPGAKPPSVARPVVPIPDRPLETPAVPATGAASSPKRPAPPREASGPVFPGWWRRPDAVVAAAVVLLAGGMVVTAIGKVRERRDVAACQERLRGLHDALASYSDVHDGRFPQVGTPQLPTAGAFADELARTGHAPRTTPVGCPVADDASAVVPARYTYTLGYQGPGGTVVGLRRGVGFATADDWVPIAADLPAGAANAHARGQNVLFVGGTVRLSTTPAAGPNGDDIYLNENHQPRAGLHLLDASLGRPDDRP